MSESKDKARKGLPVSEPGVLAELAALVPDTVVSRTLMANTAGTVTVFAFGRGQGLSAHSAPFDALVQVLDGRAEITIDETVYTLGAGEVIVMPANVQHALHAPEDFRMLLVMLKDKR